MYVCAYSVLARELIHSFIYLLENYGFPFHQLSLSCIYSVRALCVEIKSAREDLAPENMKKIIAFL